MIFIKEKRKLDTKICKLSEVNIKNFDTVSSKLFTMYLSTLINERLMLDILETAICIDDKLEEAFNNVEGN